MDSWGVLHGKVITRYKSKRDFCVRTCRFGKSNRKNRKENLKDARVVNDVDDSDGADDANDEWGFQDGEWTLTTPAYVDSQGNKENGGQRMGVKAKFARTPALDGLNIVTGLNTVTIANRLPLSSIEGNTLSTPLIATAQQPGTQRKEVTNCTGTQPRSIVFGAKAWLAPRKVSKHGRKESRTGACRELSRFLPLPLEDDDDNFATNEPCPFRVRAQREADSGQIFISVCNLTHSCPALGHKWRAPVHNRKWLGVTLAPKVTRNLKGKVKELLDGFSMDYRKASNYKQMWRAKDLVRDWYVGGQRASFHQIPFLLERLAQADPSSVVNWCTEDNNDVFKRAFVCPSAMRNALNFCQPMVCLDAAHTKNTKYPTQLFLATTMDGAGKVLILCYVVAPLENKDNWVWFLEQMHRAIHGVDDPAIPLMSDRQKGLLQAVREVYPGKIHAHCANHLRANVKNNFGKAAESFFVACVYANTQQEFEALLDRLAKCAVKGIAVAEYIRKIDAKLFARHAFPLPRLGKVSSNPAEQANSGLLAIREFAPFKILVEIWYYMQIKQNIRRTEAAHSRDVLTEPAHRRHEYNLQNLGQWQVLDDGAGTAKVMSFAEQLDYLVTLSPNVTCTCYEVQDMVWPCQHLMAWDDRDGRDYRKHFHRCWKTSSLRALYAPIIPCFLTNDLQMSKNCWPPQIAVKRGRHRVVRMQGGRSGGRQVFGEDVEIDPHGNVLLLYPVTDESHLQEPMPTPGVVPQRTQGQGQRTRNHKEDMHNPGVLSP